MLAAGQRKARAAWQGKRGQRNYSMNKNIADSGRIFNTLDMVTVLKVGSGKTATKAFRWYEGAFTKTQDFDAGMWFSHEECAVSNIQDLSQLLTAVEVSKDCFIIRGGLNTDAPSQERVRRMKNPDENGDIWFVERPRHWAMIDIDDLDLPNWADPVNDPERIINFLINLLPDCFHGVACHWQMSASAGVKPATEARAHLWFWLDRALGQDELKRWRQSFGVKVDPAVFHTVQPLYIARPVFIDNPDPLPRRSGLLPGDRDVVAVPEIDMSIPEKLHSKSRRKSGPKGIAHDFNAPVGFENKLDLLGDGDGLEGFNYPITSAIASYVSEFGADFDKEILKTDLRQWIDAAPKNSGRDEDIWRYKSDFYLDSSIQGAVDKFGTPKTVPPLYKAPEGDLDAARVLVREATEMWRDESMRYWSEMRDREAGQTSDIQREAMALFDPEPPIPVHGIEAGTGIGKSYEMRITIRQLVWLKSQRHCILIAVPNHKLAEEMADELASKNVEVAVYRGLSADDPEAPGSKMCRIAPDAEALRRGGGSLSHLCNGCPHSDVCGWQRQLKVEATVWIGAHNLLFRPRKDPIPPIDFVVVDESPIAAGLNGISNAEMISVSAAELRQRAEGRGDMLSVRRLELAEVIENGTIDAPLTEERFLFLIGHDVREIYGEVYREMEQIQLHGGMTKKERLAAIEISKRNQRRLVEAEIWKSLADVERGLWKTPEGDDGYELIPGLRIEQKANDDGVMEPRLRLRKRRKVHPDFNKPTLLLDATPKWDVYKQFWDINSITKVEAAQSHVSIRQINWSAAGAKLLKDTDISNNNCSRVKHYIESRAGKYQRVLVLCQMGLEERLHGHLPENVQISHFNAVRGLDIWKAVDCLILIGRTQPPPAEIEMQAEVIFDEVPDSLGDAYYMKKDAGLTVADDSAKNCVQMEYHPDGNSEIMRWLICEAELIQCIGRVRGVNRTADTPVQIDIIGTVPLPFMVNEVMNWGEAKPDPYDIMAGRGVVLNCDKSAKGANKVVAAMLPDLYETADAVKGAVRRSRGRTPNRYISLGKRPRERIISQTWRTALLKPPDSRYAVPIKVRRFLLRPLRDGETPPENAHGSKLGSTILVKEPLLPEGMRDKAGYILHEKKSA